MNDDFASHTPMNVFWEPKTGVQEQLWGSSWGPRVMALPNTVSSHSTHPEEQRGDRDGEQGQPQPRDGQTSLQLWAGPR